MKVCLRIGLLAVALFFAGFYLARPGYIELDIQVPKLLKSGVPYFWWEEHYVP